MQCLNRLFLLFCFGALFVTSVVAEEASPWLRVEVEVEFGEDFGQNLGTLFEVYDQEGNLLAGAGYVGAYNSYVRNDRERLHFFLKSNQPGQTVEPMPRANEMTGVYLSDLRGNLYARGRAAEDEHFYQWKPTENRWQVDEAKTEYDFHVADKVFHVGLKEITYDGETILDGTGQNIYFGEKYYAEGHLFLKTYGEPRTIESNTLLAIPWSPSQPDLKLDLQQAIRFPLRSDKEFVYSFGQLNGDVIAATNTGGVYRFRNGAWDVLLEPDMKTSFQIYAIMNYYDRLLMGQYPTGELYEYDGEEFVLHENWPPVLSGVSPSAREAQSLMIYGGDLYVGVWPWAEVWRYDQNQKDWFFVKRMFNHPELTDTIVHPYETETQEVADMYNLWGQRVTSLITMDDRLYISTSSKSGFAYQSIFGFLSGEQLLDYGRVYQLRQPGQLTFPTNWSPGPQKFTFEVKGQTMRLFKEGEQVASQELPEGFVTEQAPHHIEWGKGVFGKLTGKLIQQHSNFE
ncbi:MAG: hypothetical protein R3C11_19780 [Planctomycetaceae bacterium]